MHPSEEHGKEIYQLDQLYQLYDNQTINQVLGVGDLTI